MTLSFARRWWNGVVRWQIGAGLDRWNGARTFRSASASGRWFSAGNRVDARAQLRTWFGGGGDFQRSDVRVIARSSAQMRGLVFVLDGGTAAVSSAAPPDLWVAGDTGRARPLLLRAHPLLGKGERFETDRLARSFTHLSTEVQRWWSIGPTRGGVAAFVDSGRTSRRLAGAAFIDVDVGVGLRGAYPGRAGALRLDLGHGLRDGNTAVSVIYSSALP